MHTLHNTPQTITHTYTTHACIHYVTHYTTLCYTLHYTTHISLHTMAILAKGLGSSGLDTPSSSAHFLLYSNFSPKAAATPVSR